jgi:hypothetical protein
MIEGIQLRDAIAEDYRRNAARLGRPISIEDAQRLAQSDLELVERAEDDLVRAPSVPAKTARMREEGDAEVLADGIGGRLVRRDGGSPDAHETLPRTAEGLRAAVGERAFAMLKRMRQLMAIAPGASASFRDPGSAPWMFRRFALDLLSIHSDFSFSRRGYRFMSEADKQRKYWRDVEDVCDRSTGVLGPWWVK